MKKPFQIGDRVAVYGSHRQKGTVECIDFRHDWLGVLLDGGLKIRVYNESTIRRLRKKAKPPEAVTVTREQVETAWAVNVSPLLNATNPTVQSAFKWFMQGLGFPRPQRRRSKWTIEQR